MEQNEGYNRHLTAKSNGRTAVAGGFGELPAPGGAAALARSWAASLAAARWLWLPLLAFLVTRLGVALIAYLAVPLIADSTSPPPYHLRPPDNILLDAFGSRWDTGFYVSIAEEGYKYEGVPLPSVAFFPLLPLLMKLVTPLVGDALVAGLWVSNVALLLAAILFYRLVARGWSVAAADRAVWYLLVFPTAFFGSAIYSESLFLLAAIGAYLCAREGRWGVSGLLAIAATLTRFVGLIVMPLLLLEWWRQWRAPPDGQRPSLAGLLAPLAAPLGTAAYMVYLWRSFGDPLAFARASAVWGRTAQSPLATVAGLLQRPAAGWLATLQAGQIHFDNWIDFSFVLVFLLLGGVLAYKRRWPEAAFVLLGVLIPFSSGLLMSQRRYMWVLFPAFIVLAEWGERPAVDRAITALSLLLQALFVALFANGYWVA